MEAPLNPDRQKVYREEVVYEPIAQPVIQQPVVQQPVIQQPVVQAYVQQPVVQPVYQPVVEQPVVAAPVMDDRRSYSQVGGAAMENVQQGYYDANGNLVQREEQTFDDPTARRLNILDRTAQIIYFLMGVVELLLALRFLFRVLNADATSGFVNFICNLSGAFVAPFNGIFNDQVLNRGNVVEASTLIAMLVYAILTYGLIQLLYVLFSPGRSTRQTFTTTRRRRF